MPATAKIAAEPAPASALSPERRRLAAAIDQHRRARDRLAWLQRGDEELGRRLRAASDEIASAEGILSEARKSEGARPAYLSILLNEPGAEGQVAKAQGRLQKAEADFEAVRAAREVLGADLRSAVEGTAYARSQLVEASGAVAAGSESVRSFVTDTTSAALAQFLAVLEVWAELYRHNALPKDADGQRMSLQGVQNAINGLLPLYLPNVDSKLALRWREALVGLQSNPDAPLPDPGQAA